MDENKIRQIIQEELQKDKKKNFSDLSSHTHNGLDSQILDPNIALTGFNIRTAIPTDSASNGKIVLADIAGVRGLYAMINGTWYSVVLA